MGYTIKNLESVQDMAKGHGLSDQGEARFATGDLDATQTGVSHQRLKPGKRQSFGLAGSGHVKLDEEILEIGKLDAIRVSPETMRSFEAGEEGLEILAFGQHFGGDGELVQGWWND